MRCTTVTDLMEGYAFIKLTGYAFPGSAVARVERGIVAEGAASGTDGAVTVRAGETGVYDKLLQPLAVFLPEIARI